MDWHEIATAAIGLLALVGGWVWMRTVSQVDRIEERLTAHAEANSLEFGRVYDRIHQEVDALDRRVDSRFLARERS